VIAYLATIGGLASTGGEADAEFRKFVATLPSLPIALLGVSAAMAVHGLLLVTIYTWQPKGNGTWSRWEATAVSATLLPFFVAEGVSEAAPANTPAAVILALIFYFLLGGAIGRSVFNGLLGQND
jgi:hypothetical protein